MPGADWRFVQLLDVLPLGLALLDTEGRMLACNDAFRRTIDDPCQPGAPLPAGITVADDRPMLARAIRDALDKGKLPAELRLRLTARPEEPLVMTIARVPAGIDATLLIAVRDIREQLLLERQVAQVTRMQAIGQLAGGVAHDFNNILTANLGLVEQLLARHVPGDGDYSDLEELKTNDSRGATLIRQLLAFARQQTLRQQLVDARAAVAALAALLSRLLGDEVTLALELDEVGPIRVDPGQLEQVIVNLAVNARDAMPGGGRLVIATRSVPAAAVDRLGHSVMPAGDYVEIAVCDSGIGIDKDLGAKIYEPFFTTKSGAQGTGLGLSTVYGIVKQSGGFVFNAPAPSGGTIFSLFFPRAEGKVDVAAPIPVPKPVFIVDGRSLAVLLVEDDRAVRLVLQRALANAGFVVTAAADALAALPLIDDPATVIDVLVSDVMMPGMDGGQLAAHARRRRPELPVLLMSGYAEPPQRSATADAGVAFLAKPFTGSALADAIRAAARY
ncbi:response regulator [Sphingosinicellaceae bacterium]|nr:response regulator [Sphingosinicellaceae bacterium]